MSIVSILNAANLGFTVIDNSAPSVTPSAQSNADSKRLFNLIKQVIDKDNIYPLSADNNHTFPDCVYEIHGSKQREWLQTTTGYEGVFLLKFRDKSYDALTGLVDSFSAILDIEPGIQVTDFDARYNPDIDANQVTLEVVINTPVGFDGDASVIMIPRGCKGGENEILNCIKQKVHCQYNFVIQAKDEATLNSIRGTLEGQLLGFEQSRLHSYIEFDSDTPFESLGGLRSWVVSYRDSHIIHS